MPKTKAKKEKALVKAVVKDIIPAVKKSKRARARTRTQQSSVMNPAGVIKGKGSYFGDFMSGVGNVGKNILGGLIKDTAGSLLSGFGDYRERSSSAKYVPMSIGDVDKGASPATFIGAAAPRIRHREYIGNIYSSINFATTNYPINIGISSLFPWLSTMADSFQQYRLHGMEMYYESTSSNVSATTNTSLGTVMMSTLYEVTAPLLNSSVQVLNNEFTTSEKPTIDFYHPIECDPSKTTVNILYVRNATTAQTSFTDIGNFQVSTEGMQANGVQIGKLWITYDVEVIKPQLPFIQGGYSRWSGNAVTTTATGCYLPANTAPTNTNMSNPPVLGVGACVYGGYNCNTLTFPTTASGQYLVFVTYDNNAISAAYIWQQSGGIIPQVTGSGASLGDNLWNSSYPSMIYGSYPGGPINTNNVVATGTAVVSAQTYNTKFWQAFTLKVSSVAVTTLSLNFALNWTTNSLNPSITILCVQIPSVGFALPMTPSEKLMSDRVEQLEKLLLSLDKRLTTDESPVIVDDEEEKKYTPTVRSTSTTRLLSNLRSLSIAS